MKRIDFFFLMSPPTRRRNDRELQYFLKQWYYCSVKKHRFLQKTKKKNVLNGHENTK